MDLLRLWKEKHAAGRVRFDPDVLVIQPAGAVSNSPSWGTLLYSIARENYKSTVKTNERTSFDLELMRELKIGEFGGLTIAANPNSLFEEHLVIYPTLKNTELTFEDILDITRLAEAHPEQTFIHNRERSAASIVDWAHYQSYPIAFPIEKEPCEPRGGNESIRVERVSGGFPTYALKAQFSSSDAVAQWLYQILTLLAEGDTPHGQCVAFNFIWKKDRVWIVPRAKDQSELAARFFGGLEMGGIFCLPNADEFRRYLPDALREEVVKASLSCEPETQRWFEDEAIRLLNEAR